MATQQHAMEREDYNKAPNLTPDSTSLGTFNLRVVLEKNYFGNN